MPWGMVLAGVLIGLGLIVFDDILRRGGSKFRAYVMPVAVGIYLPWSLSVPILFGGIAALVTSRIVGKSKEKQSIHRGVLVASGLIAGEALMGILVAVLMVLEMKGVMTLPKFELPAALGDGLSTVLLLAVLGGIVLAAVIGRSGQGEQGDDRDEDDG